MLESFACESDVLGDGHDDNRDSVIDVFSIIRYGQRTLVVIVRRFRALWE